MAFIDKMNRKDKARSGITLGGIGTGGIELRKDGIFHNWNIFNNYSFGTGERFKFEEDSMLFFVVRYQEEGKNPRMKILQIDDGYNVGAIRNHYYEFPWMTGVDQIEYSASFPYAKLKFTDEEMPFEVDLEAYSPFIPHDIKNSSLPGIIFSFEIKSYTDKKLDVTIVAAMRNGAGYDVANKLHRSRATKNEKSVCVEMWCDEMDTMHSSYGSLAIASLASDSTYLLGWEHKHPYYEDVLRNPHLLCRTAEVIKNEEGFDIDAPKRGEKYYSSIAVYRRLENRSAFKHTFILGWHFPNLYSGDCYKRTLPNDVEPTLEGHYYTNFFSCAADVVRYMQDNLEALSKKTEDFHRHFYDSSLDGFILDQVNSHLNTFISSSWLTKDFHFGIQEGLTPQRPWAGLGTVDVAFYASIAAASLFPELERTTLRSHKYFQWDSGEIRHNIPRNFSEKRTLIKPHGRVDLNAQYALMVLRSFFWADDCSFLEEMWPSVKRALDYVILHRDQDGDALPDMEGAQSTYDNFPMFGAASLIASQWIAALTYAIKAAEVLKDEETIKKYQSIREQAQSSFEEKLWNGSYYILYNDEAGLTGGKDTGCLTDQMIGQWYNHFTGFECITDSEHIRQALRSILQMSYYPEYGLVNCRWPGDGFLHDVEKDWYCDQANTCWTGVELAFASFLIYQGMVEEATRIIKNVNDRYTKSGMYFDHMEWGGHYYRPMSAWAIINAFLGLEICQGTYRFSPKLKGGEIKLFFAFAGGTAHYIHNAVNKLISIHVLTGTLEVKEFRFNPGFSLQPEVTSSIGGRKMDKKEYCCSMEGDTLAFVPNDPLRFVEGDVFKLEV